MNDPIMELPDNIELREATCPTFWAKIYIAGDIQCIKQTCRLFALCNTTCVNVVETSYIYSGGEESGAIVELLRYPKKMQDEEVIVALAHRLAVMIREACNQKSYTLVTPTTSKWITV